MSVQSHLQLAQSTYRWSKCQPLHQAPRQQRQSRASKPSTCIRSGHDRGQSTDTQKEWQLSRRGLVLVSILLGANSQPAAADEDFVLSPTAQTLVAAEDPLVFTYTFASDVPSNLRAKEYWNIIIQARPSCWQKVAQQIQNSQYNEISLDLNSAPFADLRQAALYIPWALLQSNDYQAAVDCRKAYNDLQNHVQDMQRIALSAANGAAEPRQVQQAFMLMSASLDSFLATIPPKYLQ